jgi:hypothetical protein
MEIVNYHANIQTDEDIYVKLYSSWKDLKAKYTHISVSTVSHLSQMKSSNS